MSGTEMKIPTVDLNNGMAVPMVGLGTYSLHGRTCIDAVRTALTSGYRLVDTASFYSNEREVGIGVAESGLAREEVIITTKLYPNQYSDADRAIDEALRKLGTDYVDIMMLHHPSSNDVVAYNAIERAIAGKKVRAAAISCYYRRELSSFLRKVETRPVIVQNELHPYYQDAEATEYIQSRGIAVQAWYPLGGRGYTGGLLSNPVIKRIAANHGKTAAQVVLRWNTQRGVFVIPGSSSAEHLRENISIFDFRLTDAEMNELAALERCEKHDWY